jgi:hypothetical protein
MAKGVCYFHLYLAHSTSLSIIYQYLANGNLGENWQFRALLEASFSRLWRPPSGYSDTPPDCKVRTSICLVIDMQHSTTFLTSSPPYDSSLSHFHMVNWQTHSCCVDRLRRKRNISQGSIWNGMHNGGLISGNNSAT